MLGQGEGKVTPLKGAVGCQHPTARAGVAGFSTAEAPEVAKIRAGQSVSPAGGSAGTALGTAQRSLGNWGVMGCDSERQAVSSSGLFPPTGTHIHVIPPASQFTQMLSRFCNTEILFLFK